MEKEETAHRSSVGMEQVYSKQCCPFIYHFMSLIEIMEQYKEFELSSEWMVLLEATESLSEQFPGSDGVVANTSQVFLL